MPSTSDSRSTSVLPSTILVRLVREVLLYGGTAQGELAPGLAALAAWTLVTFAVSVKSFRWYDG